MSTFQSRPALRVSGLYKSYGKVEVIHGLDLVVAENSIHGLVGLNGSGKTTTLECILGLQGFDRGRIEVLGRAPRELHRARGDVVGIFDTPSLHPHLTVRQSLQQARILCDRPTRSFDEVEKLLGIERYRDFRIKQLSLGNKRRASIAHALLGNPRLVVLDEPFNGLDAGGVDDVLALLGRLNRQEGTAFLLSSHQLPYLEQVCSHLAILHRGTIAVSDSVDNLFAASRSRILVTCDPVARARDLIEQSGLARVELEDGDQLHCQGGDAGAAELNRLLVNGGVAVSGLVQQRHSLTSLFHDITSRADD